MTPSEYEEFQRQVFDELDYLDHMDQQQTIADFVAAGRQLGIDVVAEIIDKRRPVAEVIEEVRKRQSMDTK